MTERDALVKRLQRGDDMSLFPAWSAALGGAYVTEQSAAKLIHDIMSAVALRKVGVGQGKGSDVAILFPRTRSKA